LQTGLPVIGWSSDNSDVDLWVTDPRNEKCLYSHSEKEIGGRLSQDVTQGYGPEEFSLRRSLKRKYKVEVDLYVVELGVLKFRD
jgi:uncharacterized protein YfaP (DUF2135 family)